MTKPAARVRPFAEGSLLVEYPDATDEEANSAAVGSANALRAAPPAGLHDAVPGARTLYCAFDPGVLSHEDLTRRILSDGGGDSVAGAEQREHRIPASYGGDAGPDLAEIARAAGMPPEEVVRVHAAASYRVAFLGFAPGFAYLTGLPEALAAPRRRTPRPRVPAGSLAIAGPYTGIYPAESPGGWNLIGLAAADLFDPEADPPGLLAPGDRVRFEAFSSADLARAPRRAPRGARRVPSAPPGEALFRVAQPGLWSAACGGPLFGRSVYGLPPSGAFDLESLARGNAALGNAPGDVGIEAAVAGPGLEALRDLVVALSGARSDASVDGRPVETGTPFRLARGSRLAVGPVRSGMRAYVCVAGGLAPAAARGTPVRLAAGDLLFGRPGMDHGAAAARPRPEDVRFVSAAAEAVVRIVLGPQEHRFSPEGIATLLASPYRVSSTSDRRGTRLEGPALAFAASPEIPPEGTPLGGIQVPGDGQPIVLGPDRPVTGGYARVATVVAADLPVVAQARPGSTLRFRAVTLAEAMEARGRMETP